MPAIEVTTPGRQPVRLPAVCVKTGEPTEELVRLRGSAAPGWVLVTLLFGVIPYFFVHAMTSQRYELVVPLRDEVIRARRRWRRRGAAVVLGSIVAWVVAAMANLPAWAGWVFVVTLVGLGLLVFAEWRYAVGVRLAPSGAFELTRVDARFADGVRSTMEPARR
ncbi:hypothetical protein [Knoellia koreensis]|uniref:Uncharacterized protein n=1 Tax=Knoellia koreensis TaxID=2730921 RepID=A0A849HJ45_9MICO|nr:hypothetical protein [Knoellia sp. DB2414S]NNM46584.1 hypothetical protein [Knoellia sp. DB2414S]